MRLSKLMISLVCACTLTSCGSSVSKEEFVEKASNKIEEKHQYKKVKVTYSAKATTGKAEGTAYFTLKDGKYVAEKSNDVTRVTSLYFSISPLTIQIETSFKNYEGYWKDYYKNDCKVDWNVNYYVNPYKVVGTYKATAKTDEESAERSMKHIYKFDKYFNITSYEGDISEKKTSEKDGFKEEENESSHTKITFSYSD